MLDDTGARQAAGCIVHTLLHCCGQLPALLQYVRRDTDVCYHKICSKAAWRLTLMGVRT